MVIASKGVLINCEPAVKEILLHLDTQHHFIIEDLDPTHVFVDPLQLPQIQDELRRILAENVYKAPQP